MPMLNISEEDKHGKILKTDLHSLFIDFRQSF